MKKFTFRTVVILLLLCMTVTPALAATELIPVGQVIGLELENGSVTVAGFADPSPAKDAGVQEGDRIAAVDDVVVTSIEDVRRALQQTKGSAALTICRGKEKRTIRVAPTITEKGPVLGVYLKEGVTGIGTVTFYDPVSGNFAALGHGVNSADGKLLEMKRGNVYKAQVVSVRRGKVGAPGQLVGSVTSAGEAGALQKNTAQGVFGKMEERYSGDAIPVAESKHIHTGDAVIRSTVSGDRVQEYSVQILKIYPNSGTEGRNC